jgi:hypothetical protein
MRSREIDTRGDEKIGLRTCVSEPTLAGTASHLACTGQNASAPIHGYARGSLGSNWVRKIEHGPSGQHVDVLDVIGIQIFQRLKVDIVFERDARHRIARPHRDGAVVPRPIRNEKLLGDPAS